MNDQKENLSIETEDKNKQMGIWEPDITISKKLTGWDQILC